MKMNGVLDRNSKKRSVKSGLAPGTLVHIGAQIGRGVRISVIDYTADKYEQTELTDITEGFCRADDGVVRWIDIEGLHEIDVIQQIGECQGLHALVLEDILNTYQRPKVEDYGDYLYLVLKMLRCSTADKMVTEQVSLVLGSNFVISFQEGVEGDVFGPVRERLKTGKGRMREMGSDYLAYALMDVIVDNYFVVLESVGERIEELEDKVLADPSPEMVRVIHQLKREVIHLRRAVWPLREMIGTLERRESRLIGEPMGVYLRDLYDHIIQVIDSIEANRDMLAGMLDVYLSSLSNRMNEIMKFLTIIGTIFIPLTFVAGVYGMNFQFMPELQWQWGYFACLFLMFAVAGSLLCYFKRKKWL